jgi:hypothetical protein
MIRVIQYVSCGALGGKTQNIVDVVFGCDGVTIQKNNIDVFTAVRTSNLTLITVCTKIILRYEQF